MRFVSVTDYNRANDTKLICAVGSRNGTEETKLMVLDFDVEGACLKCS